MFCSCAKPLPILGTIPDFSFLNQEGLTVRKADLLGKVWVADFIYTGCSGTCPMLTSRMKDLQSMTAKLSQDDRLRFVSFTVDPENDTPERLHTFAERFQVDPKIWFFLTGPSKELEETIIHGFKISMGRGADLQLVHGEKFVLVDQQANIRGYYDADPNGLKQLDGAISQLLSK